MARVFAVFALRSLGEGGPGTNSIACRRALPTVAERRWGRGTRFLSGRELLPVQKFDKWALAHCRGIKLSRSQKFVKVQDLNCEQMCALPAIASAKADVRVPDKVLVLVSGS
jgi:hypothetical protein